MSTIDKFKNIFTPKTVIVYSDFQKTIIKTLVSKPWVKENLNFLLDLFPETETHQDSFNQEKFIESLGSKGILITNQIDFAICINVLQGLKIFKRSKTNPYLIKKNPNFILDEYKHVIN